MILLQMIMYLSQKYTPEREFHQWLSCNFGTTLDGLPYYDSTNKKLYILGSHTDGTSGHTEILITSESVSTFNTVVSAPVLDGFGAGIFEELSSTLYKAMVNQYKLQVLTLIRH